MERDGCGNLAESYNVIKSVFVFGRRHVYERCGMRGAWLWGQYRYECLQREGSTKNVLLPGEI